MALARPHSHLSNRAKVRSVIERKSVFKNVLENPFEINWPSIPMDIQNTFLARLMAVLENVPPRRSSRKSSQKSRRFGQQANGPIPEETEYGIETSPPQELDQDRADRVFGAGLHLVIGINAVTRALESQLAATRKHVVVGNSSQNSGELPSRSAPSPIVVVFACCADADPFTLLDHVLYLVAGYNSRTVTQPIKLVPLPKGSEQAISHLLGVRRAAVVAFQRTSSISETILDILETVPTVSASWLHPPDTQGSPQFVPTHIKQLRTTAPKDMKVAREQRSSARAAAKKTSTSSRLVHRKSRMILTTGQEWKVSSRRQDSPVQQVTDPIT